MPLRIVQPVSPQMPDPPQHLLFPAWKMFLQPMLEEWRNRPWQADNRVASKLRARFCARVQDLRNLMVGKSWNYGCYHDSNWNVCFAKLLNGIQTSSRRRGARLQHSLQILVERGHRNIDRSGVACREFAQKIDVARNKMVLCDDRYGVPKVRKHFKATARDLQFSFDRLIRIGHAAQHQRLRLPARGLQFSAE